MEYNNPISENQTQSALAQTPELLNSQQKVSKKKKWFLLVGAAVIILVALFFTPIPYYQKDTICTLSFPGNCIFAGWKLGPSLFTKWRVQNLNSSYSKSPVITQIPSPTSNPTANWKTYTNTTYGYSFRYPDDHTVYRSVDQQKPALIPATSTSDTVNVSAEEGMVFCCEPVTVSFTIKNSGDILSLASQYLQKFEESERPEIKNITFQGKPSIEVNGPGGFNPPYKLLIIPLGGNTSLQIVQNLENPLLTNILSTFKFTDQTQVVNWKTYTNSEGKYSLMYPPEWKFENDAAINPNAYGPNNDPRKGHALFINKPTLSALDRFTLMDGQVFGEIGIQPTGALCGVTCENLPESKFFDLKNELWETGQTGGGGPGTTVEKVYETKIGGKRAMVKLSKPTVNYESSSPNDRVLTYYVYLNNPKFEILEFSFSYGDKYPNKDTLLKTFNSIISTFVFAD